MNRYNPSEIEPKWQTTWAENRAFLAAEDSSKKKTYVSGMFPYPSGAGMHTGHAFSYSVVDAIARFYRAHGHAVLNPMGWDTFGLPAENYAIKTGKAPAFVTRENIANFKKQFKRMGVSIDWSREINTSDPEYYRWTQWVFTKLFERGLAYQKESLQWWCPVDKTVLANEQVEAGHCWRCGTLVEKKSMKQWFFKITEYADALLGEIDSLDWPEKIKTAQTNWIGKSQGAEVEFQVVDSDAVVTAFTTRPDTLFGATFLVLAPEHALVSSITTDQYTQSVRDYVSAAVKKSEIDRLNDTKEKTGVFTGAYATNPATGENIPIWVADYVLGGYGTGAIMAVPGHDERDFAFAEKFNLSITSVVARDFGDVLEDAQQVEGSVVIVYDPVAKKFGGVSTSTNEGLWLNGGGKNPGESFEQTAIRELAEETGFTTYERMEVLGDPVYSYYFNDVKKVAKRSFGQGFLFFVDPSERGAAALESHEKKFDLGWYDYDELVQGIRRVGGGIEHWLEMLRLAKKIVDGDDIPELHTGEGILTNSGAFDGLSTSEAREEIVSWLEEQGTGRSKTTFKMRDWLISRQRYWGAPIPIIHCDEHGAVPVPEDMLPVELPEIEDYAPKGDGKSALARATDWVNTTCPTCSKPAKRETDTMDGYACSSWYLLRYADPHNNTRAWDPAKVNYWSPLDFYVGGDHAVAHLLYVRFWTHVFKDMGLTDFREPVKKLVYHGYINAEDGTKMSKSKGNVIDPLDVIDQGYGADALRTYVLFMGPIELDAAWDSRGIAGVYRFLNRVWTLAQEYLEAPKGKTSQDDTELKQITAKVAQKVTGDYHRLSFNTATAALMEYVNDLYKLKVAGFSGDAWREAIEVLVRLVAPTAPHLAEELWSQLGHKEFVHLAGWPTWDEALLVSETMTIIVQVNGKLRAKLTVPKETVEDEIKGAAVQNEHVQKFLENKKPAKVVYVPGRLINIVV